VANSEGRFCGHSETELTAEGRAQAEALAARLQAIPIAAAYTSDYRRSIETCAIALAGRDVTPAVDCDLREIHYGLWEMERERDIRKRDPKQYALMRAEDPAWHPPGGEMLADVRERTAAAMRRIGAAHQGAHVLVISHGTAIACMLAEVLGMPLAHSLRLETANCGLSLLVATAERFGLHQLNETAFLPPPPGPRR
jgi:broad specificity phosphatase PhoE